MKIKIVSDGKHITVTNVDTNENIPVEIISISGGTVTGNVTIPEMETMAHIADH